MNRLTLRVPPISLCISVELLMSIIRSDLTTDVSAELTTPPQLADKENRADKIRSYIELHPDVTAADIAGNFGVNEADSIERYEEGEASDRKLSSEIA